MQLGRNFTEKFQLDKPLSKQTISDIIKSSDKLLKYADYGHDDK